MTPLKESLGLVLSENDDEQIVMEYEKSCRVTTSNLIHRKFFTVWIQLVKCLIFFLKFANIINITGFDNHISYYNEEGRIHM